MKTILINPKQIFFALFIATQILLAANATHARPYQTINTQESIVGDDLSRTSTTVQSGANQLNRFLMTQVRKAGPPDEAIKGVRRWPIGDWRQSEATSHTYDSRSRPNILT